MDIRDFEGLTKYKLFIPTLFVLTWVVLITGPIIFPDTYQVIDIIIASYMVAKVCMIFSTMIYINVKVYHLLKPKKQD